jgi:hypothetical protein
MPRVVPVRFRRRAGWRGFAVATLLFALVVAWLTARGGESPNVAGGNVSVDVVGPKQTVFDWSSEACAVDTRPDLPARAFRDDRGRVQLMLAQGTTNRRLIGPSLGRLRVDCRPIMSAGLNRHVAALDDHDWVAAPWTRDGHDVVALVHQEFEAYSDPSRCPHGVAFPCSYDAITFARSRNAGRSFQRVPPPTGVVVSSPYPYDRRNGLTGYRAPSNIVQDHDRGYYYTMFAAAEQGAQESGSCLMRTRDPQEPRSWRAWDGQSFDVKFVYAYQPYKGPPEAHVCAPVSRDEIFRMHESLTYNTYLDQYLLVGLNKRRDPTTGEAVPGVYFSLSDDLVHWSAPSLVLAAQFQPPTPPCDGTETIAYPSLLDPTSHSRTFDTTGRRPYLYYTLGQWRECRRTPNRDLVRVRLRFSR